ncbi:hypothetical protein KY289_006189 [Solanum tuberosum]|nr:hypothetical protein KY284_005882 [Solanum tuberosum]KAH0723145.1 hypothetical protein KY289_006189 [Solanum tuberosum]
MSTSGYAPLGSPGFVLLKGDEVLKQPAVISVAEKMGKTPAQASLFRVTPFAKTLADIFDGEF